MQQPASAMKYYLFSICIPYPIYQLISIFVDIPLLSANLHLPAVVLQILQLYFAIGIVVVLVGLWRSKQITSDDKLWWTVVLFIFGFMLAPLYWFMVVNKDQPEHALPTPQPDSGK